MATGAENAEGRRGSRWMLAVWGAAALLLLLPLVAMQFTDEVNWDAADFVFMGAMLATACAVLEAAVRMTGNNAYRAGTALAIAGAFLLVWMNLAVGVIGSEDNPANLMFGGVLAVGIIGAVIGRFRPDGMARALFATALAQVLVGIIAVASGWGSDGENWPQAVVVLTGFFAALWFGSAWLFRSSGRDRTPAGATA